MGHIKKFPLTSGICQKNYFARRFQKILGRQPLDVKKSHIFQTSAEKKGVTFSIIRVWTRSVAVVTHLQMQKDGRFSEQFNGISARFLLPASTNPKNRHQELKGTANSSCKYHIRYYLQFRYP